MHAEYYSAQAGFGVNFEAKVAQELAAFCTRFQAVRDGLWLARGAQACIAIDGSQAESSGAHLRWFIASETVRGTGVGKQLLQRALAFCRASGCGKVQLWTFAGLSAARHLYESLGTQWGTLVQEQRFELVL